MHLPTEPERARATAFRVHIEPEIEVLLRVAGALTGNSAEAEDLVQETLIRAWRSGERFDGAHPRAWLLTILRNTHKNMHRRQRPDLVERRRSAGRTAGVRGCTRSVAGGTGAGADPSPRPAGSRQRPTRTVPNHAAAH
jgi:RNA polymerase sigma factor (sigma-70 family)